MVVSKSGFVYGMLVFYSVIIIFMTLFGNFQLQEGLNTVDSPYYNEQSVTDNERFAFIPSVIAGFESVPFWVNALIFTPLIGSVLFVFVTTVLGALFDGGS